MTYSTDNIALASALKHLGCSVKHIHIEGRKATFVFGPEAEDIAMSVELGNIKVDALQFHQEVRRLSGLARTMANKGE